MTGLRKKKSYRVVRPDRYLRLEPVDDRVEIVDRGRVLVRSSDALFLYEGDRPPVVYVPFIDVPPALLVPSGTEYLCRWKGPASHFHVETDEGRIADGAWRYETPPEDVARLAPMVAFAATRFRILIDGQPLPAQLPADPEPDR